MTMPKLSHALLLTLCLALPACRGSETDTTTSTPPAAPPGASAGAPTSSDAIPIGEYGSMTGSESTFGQSTHQGIQLAVDEINGAGGLKGRQLHIVGPEDTASQAQNAETAVKRLMGSKVVAVLGEVASSASMAAAPVCQESHVPMISPSSTNPKVTEIGDYIFRVCFIDPFQAAVVAKFAKDTLKAKSAAIFYDAGQAYSVGFRDNFKKAFVGKGGTIATEASYSKDDKDYKAALTRLKAANPDVILVPGYYTQAGTITKQARDLGITVPLLGGDGWDSQELFTYGGATLGNCFFSDHMSADDPNPTVQNFVKAYQAKYSKIPDALAALGYDAAKLLYDAMKRAKSLEGPALRDAIAQTKGFDGVTGKITINAQRNADKPAVIIEAANGKFKFKERIAKP
jgi:branched-chain amino acid transport system substrate-binding protein